MKRQDVRFFERVMINRLYTKGGRQGAPIVGASGFSMETGELFVFHTPCAAAKREHASSLVLTTTELYAWLMRVCVSRFTLWDVWDRTRPEALPAHGDGPSYYEKLQARCGPDCNLALADGLAETREFFAAGAQTIAVWACPGGCANGGGQFRPEARKDPAGRGRE